MEESGEGIVSVLISRDYQQGLAMVIPAPVSRGSSKDLPWAW